MRAIQVKEFGGPEALRLEEVADPGPAPGQVLVRIKAAGVNPVDTYIRSGAYPLLPDLPYTPGADGAGVVEAVGDGVERVEVGQRVYLAGVVGGVMDGAYAELAVRPETAVFPLPSNASFAAGAAIGVPYATAARALFQRGRARPGETVFIHGASGSVGTAAIQLGRAFGLRVIGSAGSDAGLNLVADQGAHQVLDHRQAGYLDRLAGMTGGAGPDLILEMLANVNLERDMQVVAQRGRIVIIGNRGTIEVTPRHAMTREIDILGLALWNCTEAELQSIHAGLVAGLEAGTVRPVVRTELPLAEAAAAHLQVLQPGALGKIVLVP